MAARAIIQSGDASTGAWRELWAAADKIIAPPVLRTTDPAWGTPEQRRSSAPLAQEYERRASAPNPPPTLGGGSSERWRLHSHARSPPAGRPDAARDEGHNLGGRMTVEPPTYLPDPFGMLRRLERYHKQVPVEPAYLPPGVAEHHHPSAYPARERYGGDARRNEAAYHTGRDAHEAYARDAQMAYLSQREAHNQVDAYLSQRATAPLGGVGISRYDEAQNLGEHMGGSRYDEAQHLRYDEAQNLREHNTYDHRQQRHHSPAGMRHSGEHQMRHHAQDGPCNSGAGWDEGGETAYHSQGGAYDQARRGSAGDGGARRESLSRIPVISRTPTGARSDHARKSPVLNMGRPVGRIVGTRAGGGGGWQGGEEGRSPSQSWRLHKRYA